VPLTPRDRKSAAEGLVRLSAVDGPAALEIRRELQIMLMLNYKAEIQAVDCLGDMTDWLDEYLSGS
jgi:meiotic recombination protein SPO11